MDVSAPSKPDSPTPADSCISPQAMSGTSPAGTMSPFDFTGFPFCDEGWTEYGCPDIFALADLTSPSQTVVTAQRGFTMTSPASSLGLDAGLPLIPPPASLQGLPQGGFGSPVEIRSESSPQSPKSPEDCFKIRSFALHPGVDAAPPVSSSSPAMEFGTPVSVHPLYGATPSTHQTWTSPDGWGSTPTSAPDSPESFGYLATPPFTPQAQPLSEGESPSSDQQLQGNGRQGMQDRQSPVRDFSLRALSKMRTGFGAETLYCPGGIMAELYTASPLPPALPATGKISSSQAASRTDPIPTVCVNIASKGRGVSSTAGPMQATLRECLQDWCAGTQLQLDSLVVWRTASSSWPGAVRSPWMLQSPLSAAALSQQLMHAHSSSSRHSVRAHLPSQM